MEKFLEELRYELEKRYSGNDVNDIVDFYGEIIADRVDNGESIDDVLKQYDIQEIVKMSGPTVYSNKREYKTRDARKGAVSLIKILFSSIATIPLGILYFVFLVIIFSMIIAGFAVGLSGIITIVYAIVGLLVHDASIGVTLGAIGVAFLTTAVSIGIFLFLIKTTKIASKKILQLSSKIIRKKETA